jgi:hypothetical protein
MKCGKRHEHASVAEVRACYGLGEPGQGVAEQSMREKYPCGVHPSGSVPAELPAGIYLLGEDIYKVQRAVHGSGRMYAKIFDLATGQFTMAPGAVRRLRPEQMIDRQQAVILGRRISRNQTFELYGCCFICGRTLTDEESIELGIGPVCASRLAA